MLLTPFFLCRRRVTARRTVAPNQYERWRKMKGIQVVSIFLSTCVCECARGDTAVVFSGEKKRNNLVSDLLEVTSISTAGNAFAFTRSRDGWIFVSAAYRGEGRLSILFENSLGGEPVVL